MVSSQDVPYRVRDGLRLHELRAEHETITNEEKFAVGGTLWYVLSLTVEGELFVEKVGEVVILGE